MLYSHSLSHIMKTVVLTTLAVLTLSASLHAEPTIGDRVRRALDKAADKVGEVADKVESKSRTWYAETKENLRLSRSEYTPRADRALMRFDAEIAVLQELAINQPPYFKTRVLALQQHATFARAEFETLRISESEDVFRARQKSFEHTLWTLEAAIGGAQEELGL